MSEHSVSVVIPFFNGGDYIYQALAMLRKQTRPPDEVVIVDDGSAESHAVIARRAAEEFGSILVRQNNLGPGAARNRGVSSATSEFVAFLDVDDRWHVSKLEKQLANVASTPDIDVVLTESETIGPDGTIEWRSSLADTSRSALIDLVLRGRIHSFTSSILARRQYLEGTGGFSERLRFREDHLFLLGSLVRGITSVVPEPLSRRLLHPDSTSGVGVKPDPEVNLQRAASFWKEANSLVPGLSIRGLKAFEYQRASRNYIVLGDVPKAILKSLRAFSLEPSRPRHLVYVLAALWSLIEPSRFDYWHSGLARYRRGHQERATDTLLSGRDVANSPGTSPVRREG